MVGSWYRTDATVTFIGQLSYRDTTYHFFMDKNENKIIIITLCLLLICSLDL